MAKTTRQSAKPKRRRRATKPIARSSAGKRPSPKKKPTSVKGLDDPVSLVVYGPSGTGKTSFAAQFPSCGFICDSQERGIEVLSRRGLVPPPVFHEFLDVTSTASWNTLIEMIVDQCGREDLKTLVLESVTGIEQICFLHHCEDKFDGDMSKEGFYNRWQGPKNAARFDWPSLMDALDAVMQSGISVIVTAHSQTKDDPSPDGVSVMKYMPYCEKDTWARLHRWAQGVFFIYKTVEEDKKAKGMKRIAKPDQDRLLWVEGTPYCDAKNWFGMTGFIDLGESSEEGYNTFMEEFCK